MTEAWMIKVAAIGGLTVAGTALSIVLARVPTAMIRRATLISAGLAALALLLVVGLNPARSANPSTKALGDWLAIACLGFFGVFVLGGFTLRARK